ncbi:MAG: glycosyltransferase family 39 protein [Solidesulfovibrio sp. DCME]|uniref:glycosyltransferase family 39 protein n=1 Tax=Solidesulfovibrio sp. DCME TaxID=3447380 RepID=UPI003D102A0E
MAVWAGLLVFLAALVATRLWRLDGPSLWEDDYLNLDRALMPLADMFAVQKFQGPADTIFDFQPPLTYALQHLALAVDGGSLAARLPSVVAGLFLPVALGLLGRRLFDRETGLACLMLGTFLLFPIRYAQAIKFYAVFLCLAVTSMWLLVRAVARNDRTSWAAYALAAIGMGYAGYQGFPTLAVQAIYAVAVIAAATRQAAPGERRTRLRRAVVTLGCVGLALTPWLEAVVFVQAFLREPAMDVWSGIDARFFADILAAFVAGGAGSASGWLAAWVVAAGLGTAVALGRRQYGAVGLLGLWFVVMAVVLIGSKSHLRSMLGPRHFAPAFPVLVLLAAHGLVAVARWAGRLAGGLRGGRIAGPAVAAAGGLVLSWPSLAAYPAYYSRTMSLDREFFQWLDRAGGPTDALEFHGYKRNTKRFAARWYLPGRFAEAGTFDGPGYRRILDIDSVYSDAAAARPRLPGLALKEFDALFTTTRVSLAPAASRAPLVLDPGPDGAFRYDDDFRGRNFYTDAFAARNMTLDTELGLLRPARYSRPAEAVWAFEAAPGQEASDIRLTVAAALFKRHPSLSADSTLTVAASADGHDWTPLGVIGQEAFPLADGQPVTVPKAFFEEIDFYHGRCREARLEYAVPGRLAAGGRLYVRLGYRPGHVEGFLNIAGLELTAAVRSLGPAGPADTPLARQAGHLLANVRAVPWLEAADGREEGLFAFAAPGFLDLLAAGLPLGSPEAGKRFLARHPGIEPAAVLEGRDGRPALRLYDTTLATQGVRLDAASPGKRLRGLPPGDAGPVSLRLRGDIRGPVLRLGDRELSLPVLAPPGSVLTVTPGATGRLSFVPDWTDVPRAEEAMSYAQDLARSKRLRGELTCRGEGGCTFTYTFVSALPMTEVRLKAFPQVYANPCRKCPENAARVLASTDGGASWRTLVDETGGEPCSWTPAGQYVVKRLRLDTPATSLLLAFHLGRGEQAGFLSPSWNVDGMYVEADLDARALPPLRLPGGAVDVSLADPGENDFTLTLRGGEWPLSLRTGE